MSGLSKVKPPGGETELLTRVRLGDRDALSVLFRRHMPVIYGVAFVATGNQHDAEEAAQDAFFLLWQKRAEVLVAGDSVLPWLITTARYQAANRRRSVLRRQTVPLIEEHDESRAEDGESAAVAAELQASIAVAVAQLSPVDQDLVHACLVQGITYEEAAEALGISHSAVRNRLARARLQLRIQLAPERTEL